MSDGIATYSFLPWMRQGIANQIVGGASENGRAVIDVGLQLTGTALSGPDVVAPIDKKVALFGPGDIQGIDSRAIFRTDPRNWITNFETNYLPAIEFYDEDFPWRYTPLPADAQGRLLPWIALIVLEEREENKEFEEGRDVRNKPLPYIEVTDPALFPPADQLWAWAHVHVNRSLAASDSELFSSDMGAVLPKLQAVLNQNPDLAYSRIVCPRKLGPNRAYHAFLVPVFESGRRAGLGLDPHENPALPAVGTSAWELYGGRPEPDRYPYYYRWYFRTGGEGDFESLARLIKPKKADRRVGRRDMDGQNPGSNVRGIQAGRPDLGGIFKLGGALRIPDEARTADELLEVNRHENWATPYPQPIQQDIATIVNLADDYAAMAAAAANKDAELLDPDDPTKGDPDPVITPPLYGTWHALTKRLLDARAATPLPNRANWVHDLNLDPRFRAAAGFGTRVVQDQQEKYMNAAWEQIGSVLEGNRRIRLGQMARGTSLIWYDSHLLPMLAVNRQSMLLMTAPLNKRVMHQGATVHHQLTGSFVQPAMTSAVLRRVTRPRSRLMTTLPFDAEKKPDMLLDRVNEEEQVSAAPPKVRPPGATTVGDVGKAIEPQDAPQFIRDWLRRYPWLRWLPFLLALLLILLLFLFAPIGIAAVAAVALAGAAWFLFNLLSRWQRAIHAADAVGTDTPPPSSIDDIPPSDFVITEPGSGFVPTPRPTDSFEGTRFKTGLRDVYTLLDASAKAGVTPPKKRLDLGAIAGDIVISVDPRKTVPRRVMSGVFLPPRVRIEIGEQFVEAMAYPEFDTPMYEPLKNINSELFLPNINHIAQNSVTILETNQKFIESYMVGLNHEFARELLWREYPTDQRGSCFRQFWDVSGFLNVENIDADTLKEKLRDIHRLDFWPQASDLGTHNNRQTTSGQKATVVLVIRGELLKRYPTAVIYAYRARWQFTGGQIDKTLERRFEDLAPGEEAKPPRTKVRPPLFEAKVDPDIYFFGFDLTVGEARGGTGDPGDEDPGWFFVIKERPGEPRFGLDIGQSATLHTWNDLSWPDLQPGAVGTFIPITNAVGPFDVVSPPGTDEQFEQSQDDVQIEWNLANMTSAELAYIFFQSPVLVGMHASLMV